MPPSGFNKHVVEGALQFVKGCYLDLLEEVQSGKHASYEEAIEFELGQIEKVLLSIHINSNGQLVKRSLSEIDSHDAAKLPSANSADDPRLST